MYESCRCCLADHGGETLLMAGQTGLWSVQSWKFRAPGEKRKCRMAKKTALESSLLKDARGYQLTYCRSTRKNRTSLWGNPWLAWESLQPRFIFTILHDLKLKHPYYIHLIYLIFAYGFNFIQLGYIDGSKVKGGNLRTKITSRPYMQMIERKKCVSHCN